MLSDLRFALRSWRRSPLFAAAAILTLAIGAGAATTVFSFIHAVLMEKLPYRDPDRIALLFETSERARQVFGATRIPVSPAMAEQWKSHGQSFESMGTFRGAQANLGLAGQPERLRGAWMSRGALDTMGVPPLRGRFYTEAEQQENAPVALISEPLWRNRLGAGENVVGSTIRLDNQPVTVIGIMPASFTFPRGYELSTDGRVVEPPQFWRPLSTNQAERANFANHNTSAVGRLKPDVTAEQAQAELSTLSSQAYSQISAEAAREFGASVTPYPEHMVRSSRNVLLMLGGAVALVLLIACLNVAGLLTVRAVGRGREMAVRSAIGAPPARLLRQTLAESLLLALAGGAGGTLLAVWGIGALRALAAGRIPRLESVALNAPVLGVSLLVALFTAVLFGLAPAILAARTNLADGLKQGGRGAAGAGRPRLRAALVVAQIAVCMTLLSVAGLLGRSLFEVLRRDRGFQTSGVLTMRVPLPAYRYATAGDRRAFFDRLLANLEALPQVDSAGLVNQLPLSGEGNIHAVAVEGRLVKQEEELVAEVRNATPGYFDAIRMPLRAGRWLDASDVAGRPEVAVINETMARRFWPGGNAVGKRFRLSMRAVQPWITVVGVAADSRQASIEKEIAPQIIRPFAQDTPGDMCLTVRTSGDPALLAPLVRAQIGLLDPEQPVLAVKTMQEVLDESVSGRRLQVYVLGAFAWYALVLAALGLHGVVAYAVAQRTREFGLRLALGAQRGQLSALVLRHGIGLAGLGLALGLAGALALGRVVAGFLYGVRPGDPLTLSLVALLLGLTALLACLIPAWRAARVDPLTALRDN